MATGSTDARTALDSQYRALLDAVALLDERSRVVVRILGERAAEALHGLVTNDVQSLAPGQGTYALMLTPKGRPVADMRLLRLDDEFWADMPAACLDPALVHLRKYVPPNFATFNQVAVGRLGLVGPLARDVLNAWFGEPLASGLDPLATRSVARDFGDTVLARREAIEGPGFDLYVPEAACEKALDGLEIAVLEAGGQRAGPAVWETVRIERGIPAYGVDFADDRLAQEIGQDERALDFEKGCYTGQEVVARIHYRGHVNKILRGFRLPAGSGRPGASLYEDDRERGTLTSTTESPRYGPIALGYARREIALGAQLALASGGAPEVEVVELPFDPPLDPAF